MKLSTEQLAEVKAFAVEHYDDKKHRYDTFVECYSDAEWQELAERCKDMKAVYREMKSLARAWQEQQSNCW